MLLQRRKYLFILVPLVITLGALYYWFSLSTSQNSPDTGSQFEQYPETSEFSSTPSGKVDSVEMLVKGLHDRLVDEPDDAKGWALLAKSYSHLQRWQAAREAFEKAKSLGYTGDAPALVDTSRIPPQILIPHSDRPKNNLLTQMIKHAGVEALRQQAESNPPSTNSADTGNPPGLKLRVTLAPNLANEVSPEKAVFIFARVATNNGTKKNIAPLAVVRKRVRDLPLEIVLNDSMAMIPGRTISSVQKVVVGARVSISGNPIRQHGDFEQLSDPISSDYSEQLALVISQPFKSND